MPYFLAPLIGWFVSGSLKYLINRIRFGRDLASEYAGNGGFPSTHTSTVATVAFLIGFGEGWLSPTFGLAVGVLMIVVIDATGLRIAVGQHAEVLNKITPEAKITPRLRERMGHTYTEVAGGLVVGFVTSFILYQIFSYWGWA